MWNSSSSRIVGALFLEDLDKRNLQLAMRLLHVSPKVHHASSYVLHSLPLKRFLHVTQPQLSHRLPASHYRGDTSRAVFFKTQDLPEDKSTWPSIFLGVPGSPDSYGRQLDGMGCGISSLSKICVVGPPTRPDADMDYTFVAVGVKDNEVYYSSNCGNMISAVGPYAVDSGLFSIEPGRQGGSVTVRIHNTNSSKIITSTFPVTSHCEFEPRADFTIDGVSGTASRIQLDFIDPVGSHTGKLLPTSNKIDAFDGVRTACVDVGNPCCFVQASELGIDGGLTPSQIDDHPTLLGQLDSIRRQAGVKMGLGETPATVPGSTPKICMVSRPGENHNSRADLRIRSLSVGQPHKAVPITVALSTATASRLHGTVVKECVSEVPVDLKGVTLAHASGTLMVGAKFGDDGTLESATVFMTARRLMDGMVFWK